MIKLRIDKTRLNEPIFKIALEEIDIQNNRLLKRISFEGKRIKGLYTHEIPMKFFYPVISNLNSEDIYIDTRSNLCFLEFADEFEEEFEYSLGATPKYMRKWREFGCPNIYKIKIDAETKKISKKIAFKKIEVAI